MRQIIVGYGEVGQGLYKVIGGAVHDPFKGIYTGGRFDVMHVCIPYVKDFVKVVKHYQKVFKPSLTIIHSTVPIGTSRKCNAVHSPIRGVHPNIDKGIRTFTKFFGGKDAKKAARIFKKLGIQTFETDKPENTEAGKLWDTTQYGLFILINREIFKWCKKNKVDFDVVYTKFNQSYNAGYSELARPEVMRPFLKYTTGKIGGHCILPNAKLFKNKYAHELDKSR